MEKRHFGDTEKGCLCRGGFDAAKEMTLVWDQVTCKNCQNYQVPAKELPAEVLATWLNERIATNTSKRAWHAERRQEWEDRKEAQVSTEAYTLYALQHDVGEACPGDAATIEPLPTGRGIHTPHGSKVLLKLVSQHTHSSALVTVRPIYTWNEEQGVLCDIAWDTTVTDVWTDHEGEVQEHQRPLVEDWVPVDEVVARWKGGEAGARQRDREEQERQKAELEDD